MSPEPLPSSLALVDDERLRAMREEYAAVGLDEAAAGDDPVSLFERWLAQVVAAGIHEPNAMALATATPDGQPSVRLVLLKGADARGFVFFTNTRSRKGVELAANPRAALALTWHAVQRQVRVEGPVQRLSVSEDDAYFASRPYGSRLGALASPQGEVVPDRQWLEDRYAALERSYPDGDPVPRPSHWGGYRVVPEQIEFWQGRRDRLHDRLLFVREDEAWRRRRLAP